MVKKLLKHEIYALWRLMVPIWCVLFGVAVLGRFVRLFEQETVAYSIINGSAVFFYVVSLVACIACPFVFAITRFYRNLFTGEGYLTLTLPVTTHQHIFAKLTASIVTGAVTLVAAAVSVILVTLGDLTVEIGKAVGYLLKLCAREWGGHLPMYAVEGLIAVIAVVVTETLLIYACICIGQQSKKNRVLAAVGAYFGVYVVKQVLGTILLLIGSAIDWEPLWIWVSEHPFATVHLAMWGGIAIEGVLCVGFYWLSHRLITRRLNLE